MSSCLDRIPNSRTVTSFERLHFKKLNIKSTKIIIIKKKKEEKITQQFWEAKQFSKNKYEKKGILSNHLILFLQLGQKDRPLATLPLFGRRYIQTLEKLPHRLPKMKNAIYSTNYIFICEANCKIPSKQYCTNITAS